MVDFFKAEFMTSLIEKGPGFMKFITGASDFSRVPTTQERLGSNMAQALPTVKVKSIKKTVETPSSTGLNVYIYQRWLVSQFEPHGIVAIIIQKVKKCLPG